MDENELQEETRKADIWEETVAKFGPKGIIQRIQGLHGMMGHGAEERSVRVSSRLVAT